MCSNLDLNNFLAGNVDEVIKPQSDDSQMVNIVQDAATITDALQQIREMLSNNKPLANKIPLVVKEKSQNDKARYENLLHYVPDVKTINLLEQYHDIWLKSPALFDEHITSSQWAAMDPWTRIASTNLETKQDLV